MLDKLDLELFEILDSEIDKTLSFGSWIKIDWWVLERYDRTFEWYTVDKIIWHYPTTNEVLRYINHRLILKFNLFEDYIYIFYRKGIEYRLYLKPIQKYSDEQKEELITFLNLISK